MNDVTLVTTGGYSSKPVVSMGHSHDFFNPFGPPMWQAEADTELTLSASPTTATAVGQKALALAKRRYSTVRLLKITRCFKFKGERELKSVTPFNFNCRPWEKFL